MVPVAVVYVAGVVFFVFMVFLPSLKLDKTFMGRVKSAGVVLGWPVFLFFMLRGHLPTSK